MIPRLANVVPAVVLAAGVAFVPDLPALLVTVVRNVCFAFIILTVALAVAAALDLANEVYQRRREGQRDVAQRAQGTSRGSIMHGSTSNRLAGAPPCQNAGKRRAKAGPPFP